MSTKYDIMQNMFSADCIRIACAETIRVQANHLHGIANKLACQ